MYGPVVASRYLWMVFVLKLSLVPCSPFSFVFSRVQTSEDPSIHYNVPLLNAVVLFVGMQAITVIQGKSLTISTQSVSSAPHMDIFQSLAAELDTEGENVVLVISFSFLCRNRWNDIGDR